MFSAGTSLRILESDKSEVPPDRGLLNFFVSGIYCQSSFEHHILDDNL